MRQNAFGGRAPPRPAGELERSSSPLAAIGGAYFYRERTKGIRRGKGREGGKGKDDLHPTLFLGPALNLEHRSYKEVWCACVCTSANSTTWIEWSLNWREPRANCPRVILLHLPIILSSMLKVIYLISMLLWF